jgi:dinuclear metal center YbgI/SA1388 family protein
LKRAFVTVRDVFQALDERFPFAHRADWDNVGILLGDPGSRVRSVAFALDATSGVISSLRRRPADLLVTHHPVVHSPLKSVRPDHSSSRPAYELIRMGVAVISAHTNADVAPRGVSFAMARRLGLLGIRSLIPGEPSSDACKIVVFVPSGHADDVFSAAAKAGAGRIGGYAQCSFRTTGTGTFFGAEGTDPNVGVPGREERVEEVRLETVAAGSLVSKVLRAVRAAHPYEEPAIDVVPLRGGALGGGVGAVGELSAPCPLDEFLGKAQRALRASWIKIAGPRRKTVNRVAVVGGSGAEFADAARASGADLFITGDVKYHQALEAAAGPMPVADVGHASGEQWILPEFRRVLLARYRGIVTARIIFEGEPLRAVPAEGTIGGTRP